MLNYANLNDVEFEYLCKDVLSKMLGVQLQRFASGKDGGIDLTDDVHKKNIVVQVKHYIKTDTNGLIRSLENEIEKVKKLQPKQYYVCCSKELTPDKKLQIYSMFSDFMESTANIITTIEIDDFLRNQENASILRDHFKLWLESTNILTDIFSNDIFIDSESLISNIHEEEKLFVKTVAFDKAIKALSKNNVLIIVGDPGVGKTITSKMLVLHYAAQGYHVRYTTDVSDLSSLKKAITNSRDTKEIILLDDCFGQAYFDMKSSQENELLAIIRHVKINPNKLLILNSRVTIYKEAQQRTPELVKSFERKEYKVFILDMNNLSLLEKAKIFYNHLFFNDVPKVFLDTIKENKNYRKIIGHPNYNPRIIEYICNKTRINTVPQKDFLNFIQGSLDNPNEAWKNEYERRLSVTDRLFLTTLYSLTNTTVSLKLMCQCYNHRLTQTGGIDYSVNQFEQSLARLNGSFVKIIDERGTQMISISNPSINDFLRSHLESNSVETKKLMSECVCIKQLNRVLDKDELKLKLLEMFKDKSILNFFFDTDFQKAAFITEFIASNGIFDESYSSYVMTYVSNIDNVKIDDKHTIWVNLILENILEKKFCSFYKVDKIVKDFALMEQELERFELAELIIYIESIDWLMVDNSRNLFVKSMKKLLKEAIEFYVCEVPVDSYDINIGEFVDDRRYDDEFGGHIDADAVVEDIEDCVKSYVKHDLEEMLQRLPTDIYQLSFITDISISISGVSNLVYGYLNDDYDDEYRYDQYMEDKEIDYIFER